MPTESRYTQGRRRLKRLGRWVGSPLVLAMLMGESAALTEPVTGMEFRWIPAGCIRMGEPTAGMAEDGFHLPLPEADEVPGRTICVSGFWMGVTEVTVGQWQRAFSPPGVPLGSEAMTPKSAVSWQDAQRFVRRIGTLEPTRTYRLPTEAEWEYACWGGSRNPTTLVRLHGQDRYAAVLALSSRAVLGEPKVSDPIPAPVGSRDANGFGLKDMLGNLWEWAEDSYSHGAYKSRPEADPKVQGATADRVLRGGSFKSDFDVVRCGIRNYAHQDEVSPVIGFRLVIEGKRGK